MDENPYQSPKMLEEGAIAPEKRDRLPLATRVIGLWLSLGLFLFWIFFALASYPWIVIADNVGSGETARQNAALAGVALAVISAASALLMSGGCGHASRGWIAGLLLCGLFATTWWLYPAEPIELWMWRLPAQLVGGLILFSMMAAALKI